MASLPPGPGREASRRLKALLALASPLLILLSLVAMAMRPASDRVQALPALVIGSALLITSWVRRRRRRRKILRALRLPVA
jgi:hypothetical protein